MRIVHVSTVPVLRGGERQIAFLHEGLRLQSIESVLLCNRRNPLKTASIEAVMAQTSHRLYDLFSLGTLYGAIRARRPCIVHCHDSAAITAGAAVAALLRVPYIVSRKVVYPIAGTAVNRWKYGHAAAVIAVSTAAAQVCKTICPYQTITIIHDGVDASDDHAFSRSQARRLLGIPDDAFVIGTVGHFTSEKNFPLLLRCADFCQEQKEKIIIACIGPIGNRLLQNRSIPPCFKPCGLVPHAHQYYSAFDSYLSTSKAEGLGSALLDALVRDIPTIACDAGGNRDLYEQPDTELIACHDEQTLFSRIRETIGDYQTAKNHAAACGAFARQRFSLYRFVDSHLHLYETIWKTKLIM
ncbi:MAG: glycosyltransferase family 4 protein [Chitinivibrionales bacterium]|nr:glycosyltransferase family 4 protein [Chitinivibrionales bacterium]